jgi:hypothetical protein
LLPSEKAFVLQLARSTDRQLRSFSGRVEHLASGRRRRFESVGQFLEQVTRLLHDLEARKRPGRAARHGD